MTSLVVALLAGVSAALLVLGVGDWLLARGSDPRPPAAGSRPAQGERAGAAARAAALLEAAASRLVPAGERRAAQRRRLARAGYPRPGAAVLFWGARTLLTLGLAAAGLAGAGLVGAGVIPALATAAGGAATGWLAPAAYLRRRASGRQRAIRRALPDAVDLLVVSVEAGLDLDRALASLGRETARVCPALGQELDWTRREMRFGLPRDEAMKGLGARTGVDGLAMLGDLLAETHHLGTSVAGALWTFGDELREKLRHEAEARAARTPVLLVFPLVFFVLPATFVVLLVPVLLRLLRDFGGP